MQRQVQAPRDGAVHHPAHLRDLQRGRGGGRVFEELGLFNDEQQRGGRRVGGRNAGVELEAAGVHH